MKLVKTAQQKLDRFFTTLCLLLALVVGVSNAGATDPDYTSAFTTIATTVAAIGAAAVAIAVAWVTAKVIIKGIMHFGK